MDNGSNEHILIDTSVIDRVLNSKERLIKEYNEINDEYDRIVSDLLKNWQGRGATAFKLDAGKVKTNIAGIYDILKIMCDTLEDCKSIIAEADSALGDYNSGVAADVGK